jgi:hypothetical protein
MKPKEAAQAANVNYDTARKWKKKTYKDDSERKISVKKTNKTPNRPASQLNETHKIHLINFFDEDSTAVKDLTAKFEGLDIKKNQE